ncbi:hypothetical protein KSU03_05990 [Fusobacterium polymorphum]|uniref:YozE SAM-like domain-containing protein n=1 Tax=Fusobacterium nucleatum subsp. polymorphum TaxID=76857 RepID=A0A2C5ZY98_FUSNP|nr:YozE family protein [Fusobacterium polymorphum]PHI04340.1 hypothetical protein CBG52_11300 [Fusobacterium polymorphum]
MKSFIEWLKTSQYLNSDSIKGDIARDILRDKTFPDTSEEERLVSYMNSKLKYGALAPLSEFKAIYKSYLAYINKDN